MINESNKHSWCVNAYHGMSANNNGTTKICCMINNKEEMALGTNTIKENFNKPKFIEVRSALENGERHKDCSWCWEEEDAGRKSKRLRDNEKYIGHLDQGGKPFDGLAKFELNLGNTCNIKCRTFSPWNSSQWIKEKYEITSSSLIKKENNVYQYDFICRKIGGNEKYEKINEYLVKLDKNPNYLCDDNNNNIYHYIAFERNKNKPYYYGLYNYLIKIYPDENCKNTLNMSPQHYFSFNGPFFK
jgi:hypothetical protein